MTNYNERLDDVLSAVYLAGTENGLSRRITDPEEIMLRKEAFIKGNRNRFSDEAKQALTSLIKELVAEAKPTNYTPKGHHPDACLNHEKYTSACCGCQKQRARLQEIDEFEQNLLKELEEV